MLEYSLVSTLFSNRWKHLPPPKFLPTIVHMSRLRLLARLLLLFVAPSSCSSLLLHLLRKGKTKKIVATFIRTTYVQHVNGLCICSIHCTARTRAYAHRRLTASPEPRACIERDTYGTMRGAIAHTIVKYAITAKKQRTCTFLVHTCCNAASLPSRISRRVWLGSVWPLPIGAPVLGEIPLLRER